MSTIPAMPDALPIALEAAVPLRLMELAALSPVERDRVRMRWAHDASDIVASQGDTLMFGSKRSGAAANVFNHLARGLAALAYAPGGVTFAGRHWEAGGGESPTPVREPRRARPVVDAVESL